MRNRTLCLEGKMVEQGNVIAEMGLADSSDENSDLESLDEPNVHSRNLEDEWLQKYKDVQTSLAGDDYHDNVPSHLELRCETQHHNEDYHKDRHSHESEDSLPLNHPSESSWQDKNNCDDGCNIHFNANSAKCSNQTGLKNHLYHVSETNSNASSCERQIKQANEINPVDYVKHNQLKETKTDLEICIETDLHKECTSYLEIFLAKNLCRKIKLIVMIPKEIISSRNTQLILKILRKGISGENVQLVLKVLKKGISGKNLQLIWLLLREKTLFMKNSVEKDCQHPTTDYNDSVGKQVWSENITELNKHKARTPDISCVEPDSQESVAFERKMTSGNEASLEIGTNEKDVSAKENTKPSLPSHQIYRNLHLVTLRPTRGVKVKPERKNKSPIHSKQSSSRFVDRKPNLYSANANVNDSPHALESSRGDTENTPTRTGMDGSCHRTADNTINRIQRSSSSVSMDAESKGGNSNQKVPPYRVNATQRCLDNTEYLYSKLRAVYGECTDEAVREAVVQLNTKYSGYMLYFCDTFLDPALELIKTLKKNFQEPGCPSTFQWPVCCQGSIIIHLQDTKQLLPGQQYIYIRRSSGGQIQLAVKYCSIQGLHDVILRKNNEIANVLNMEWSNRFKMRSDEDLGKLLQRTMVSFEDSIQRIKLEESADSCKDCKRNRQIPDGKKVLSAVTNRSRFSNRPASDEFAL
ncbi:Hypothetical predicted protein, partial [Mytilus galloprovincialis]